MKDELILYRTILEAIKLAESNLDLESDLRDIVDKKQLETYLLDDVDIQKKALEKVKRNDGRRKME